VSIGIHDLKVSAGENEISGHAFATSSFKSSARARVVIELSRGGIPVDDAISHPVTSNGTIAPFVFADLGPGEYTVTATFMQGKRVQELQETVTVGDPEWKKNAGPILQPPKPGARRFGIGIGIGF
jgi:hypothetical protein